MDEAKGNARVLTDMVTSERLTPRASLGDRRGSQVLNTISTAVEISEAMRNAGYYQGSFNLGQCGASIGWLAELAASLSIFQVSKQTCGAVCPVY